MPVPLLLQRLDDRVLGARAPARAAWQDVVWGVVQVSRVVLLLLAAVLLAAVAVVVLHVDESGPAARRVLAAALEVAGPFADAFDVERRELRAAASYGTAAGVYLLAAVLLGRLPGVRS